MVTFNFNTISFWSCYVWSGISDILDGYLARKLRQQSEIGATLDSISDFVFALAILIVVITNMSLSLNIWCYIGSIAIIRLISYSVGFYKYRKFSSLHTLLNKITGLCIFAFPLLYIWLGFELTGIVIYIIALLSSLEELVIMLKSKELDSDVKSILS